MRIVLSINIFEINIELEIYYMVYFRIFRFVLVVLIYMLVDLENVVKLL